MLLIPVRDISGKVQSLQYIAPDGTKRFLIGGKVQGGHFILPGKPEKPLVLCEGYATGVSIHLASESTVYVTFSANNLPVVENIVRRKFTDATIMVCGDNDETGRGKGQEAAQTAQARLVLPTFTARTGKDFNDLQQSEGLQEVRRHLEVSERAGNNSALVSLGMGEFLSMSIPERGYLLSPILPVQGIGILYAPRGIGKTFAALSIAVAVASGGAVFNWRAPMPKRTLYVDGEMPAWLLELRRRGMTVLLIHHAGKSGDQRGTSAREDIMDTVISLRRPREYSMAEGARFEVHLTKARGILGDDAKPFEANLITEGNALHWQVRELEDVSWTS